MADFLIPLIVLAALTIVAPMVVTWMSCTSTLRKRPEEILTEIDPTSDPSNSAKAASFAPFAGEHGFRWVGAFRYHILGGAFVAAWFNPELATYFCMYVLPKGTTSKDFITTLDGNGGLTTGDTGDGSFMPLPPGSYTQSFGGVSIQEQWLRHQRALRFLMDTRNARLVAPKGSFIDTFIADTKEHMKHVSSIPLWPLRAPYWYFVRRKKTGNQPIEKLIEAGLMRDK